MPHKSSIREGKSHLLLTDNGYPKSASPDNSFFKLAEEAIGFCGNQDVYELDYIKGKNGNEYRAKL